MGKLKLPYIDDEHLNLLAFKAQLRREFDVFCATDIDTAFSYLNKYRIDFVFSDQRMPDMQGTDFLRHVQAHYPHPYRLIISGFTEDQAIRQSVEQGIVHIAFEKPYRINQIKRFIYENNAEQESDA